MSIKTASLLLFNSVSSIGSRIFSFACAFYILQHTDSTASFTLYLTAIAISTLLTAPLLGIFAGRYHNKMMVIILQLLNVIFLFVFTIVFDMYFNYIIILGIMLNMTDTVIRMLIDVNVDHIVKEDVERYISLTLIIKTAIHVLAPIIGGLMIAFFNIETLALFNLLTEGLAILFVLNLPLNKEVNFENRYSKESLRKGYQYLKQKESLWRFCVVVIALDFLAKAFSIGMPIVAVQSMQLSALQWGIVMLGGTVGGFVVSYFYSEKDLLKLTYRRAMILQSVTMLLIGGIVILEFNTMLAMLLLFVLNGLMRMSRTLANIPDALYLQQVTEVQYQAHVMRLQQTLLQVASPVALLFFGLMLNGHQVFIFLSVAVLTLALYAYLRRFLREINSLNG